MSITAEPGGFPIASVAAPPGAIGLCPLPGVSGNLAGDLSMVLAWHPEVVVSLTEQAEMVRLGAGDLGHRLERAGVSWVHLPIRDFGGLDGHGQARWPGIAQSLHRVLDRGGRVLCHCRGGLGRSGMIVMRLMVERGAAPDAALDQLRLVRPGAVETEEQRRWAGAHSATR